MNNIDNLFLQTFVYGDLYRYDVEKNEWKLVSSPNSPPPRSAHQTVAWKNNIYMFGNRTLYWGGHSISKSAVLVYEIYFIFLFLLMFQVGNLLHQTKNVFIITR